MLFLAVEESEPINQDGSVGTLGSKRQSAHISADPTDLRMKFGREMLRSFQERGGEVEANDLGPTLRQDQCMPAVTTTDIEDP